MYASIRSNGYGESPPLSNGFAGSNGCPNLAEAASVAQRTSADAAARHFCWLAMPARRIQSAVSLRPIIWWKPHGRLSLPRRRKSRGPTARILNKTAESVKPVPPLGGIVYGLLKHCQP